MLHTDEDGERQELDLVNAQSVPVHIALVLDTSDSVAGLRLRHLQDAARQLLDDLDDEDEAALISFSHHLTRDAELTRDKDRLRAAVDAVRGDAIYEPHCPRSSGHSIT